MKTPLKLAVLALAFASSACTQVRYSRRNPQTGEVWTVYAHTFSDDTVSYCAPPQMGGVCRQSRTLSSPPQFLPSQTYAPPPPAWGAPAWGPAPAPNGWRR